MATSFTEIYDLFLMNIQDYKLNNLYATSTPNFETYLKGFLIRSIPNFKNCASGLNYNNSANQFTTDKTLTEKLILSNIMVQEWFLKEVHNVTQFNILLSDTDFKRYAEANNLKSKADYSNMIREKISQLMTDYGLENIDWEAWADGNFS
jgi:hypothetical protein